MILDKRKGLSANSLKLIAAIAMVADHAAWMFVDTASGLGIALHTIGRLTIPIMSYFIAEGYYRTGNTKRYAARLLIFAAISHAPYNLFINIASGGDLRLSLFPTSVMFSLLCGLILLLLWDKGKNPVFKLIGSIALVAVTAKADWQYFAPMWVLCFGMFHGQRTRQFALFAALSLCLALSYIVTFVFWQPYVIPLAGLVLALPLIGLYNGERGRGGKAAKWLFYWLYPIQFAVLIVIAVM